MKRTAPQAKSRREYLKATPAELNDWVAKTGATTAMHDPVNHPKHYTSHPSGVECIQVTRHMRFNPGNAIKYIWRAEDKGDPIENYEKAIWYLRDEIERIKNATKSS